MDERSVWDAWERGESRCPYCVNMDDEEFFAMCDCSRAHWEKTGEQLRVHVVGHPESETVVGPVQDVS